MNIGLTLDGGAELRKLFRTLPDRVVRKVSREGVDAGAEVLVAAAKSQVPVHEGKLYRALGHVSKVYPDSDKAVAVVGVNSESQEQTHHHHIVHDGRVAADGSRVEGDPYLERASRNAAGAAGAAVTRAVDAGIRREAAR